MVKVFTMVKGEVDIVKDWVMYHGSIFGFTNLHIIDNYSRDGTFEILKDLQRKYNIHVYQKPDYKEKGNYMTALMRTFCKNELCLPIDIDEFIVIYNKDSNTIDCCNKNIWDYLNTLPPTAVYKMNYIFSKIVNECGYNRAAVESSNGKYMDWGDLSKSFFHSSIFKGVIDHGNHYQTNKYLLTKLCLVHFHCRNLTQMQKKIYNNVSGLGHDPNNIDQLIIASKNKVDGHHHIDYRIDILQNKYTIPCEPIEPDDISLSPLNNKIISIDAGH